MNTSLLDSNTLRRGSADRLRVAWMAVLGLFFLLSACKSIEPHGPPLCRLVDHPKVLGAEDITIDQETGIALISVDHRLRGLDQDPKKRAQGAIYAYDLTVPRPRLKNLTHDLDIHFHPHGIGLYTGENGMKRLFVVNHPGKTEDTVEIFDYDPHAVRLSYAATIHNTHGDRLMHSPNDVIPVGPRSFYVTNFSGARSPLGLIWETLLGLRRSYVLYYDGSSLRKVVEKRGLVNGINLSPDGGTLYVAAGGEKKVYAYVREADGSLRQTDTITVNTNADNIEVDAKGHLWIGAHPIILPTFVVYGMGLKKRSPSEVIKIPFDGKKFGDYKEIYLSKGRPLSGSSVAAVYKDRLLIGSVFEGFLDCTLR